MALMALRGAVDDSPDGRHPGREVLLALYIHVAHRRGQAEIYLRDKGTRAPPIASKTISAQYSVLTDNEPNRCLTSVATRLPLTRNGVQDLFAG